MCDQKTIIKQSALAIALACAAALAGPVQADGAAASKAAVADIARDSGKQVENALRPKQEKDAGADADQAEKPAPAPAATPDEPSHY
jgi:hypothetical protein